ncbi:hypothetical protein [Candidatus Thiosymbion oneisti]|uniref:hypothetical protein n=1 Tax=Candidatus Thiosymbion oneisti TaxID=589554 RepID=UPI00105C235C|nr:hypothetical protein [Candidatus Thiosymbion oneisti]
MSSFIEKCINGEVLLDDIDDFVDSWHAGTSKLPLHHYLGMSRSEYSLWIADPDVLPYIINAHRYEKDISELLDEALSLATRSVARIKR